MVSGTSHVFLFPYEYRIDQALFFKLFFFTVDFWTWSWLCSSCWAGLKLSILLLQPSGAGIIGKHPCCTIYFQNGGSSLSCLHLCGSLFYSSLFCFFHLFVYTFTLSLFFERSKVPRSFLALCISIKILGYICPITHIHTLLC
jgi:hypothetical protein